MRLSDVRTQVHLAALLAASLAGCYAAEEPLAPDAERIQLDLEEPDGALGEHDEAPAFGMEATFERLELLEGERPVDDGIAATAEYASMAARPGVRRVGVAIVWGRIPADMEARRPRVWDGAVRIEEGLLRVRAAVRFEGRSDELLPRPDARTVAFRSATLPHHDGLLLTALVPAGADPRIHYVAAAPGPDASAPLSALLEGPVVLLSDELGNRMVALAMELDEEARCGRGFVLGAWHSVRDGLGVTFGRLLDQDGRLVGHSRGIYGVRRNGRRVFAAKLIDRDGRLRALALGTYGEGTFGGVLRARGGERGQLHGHYREARGREALGFYLGRWVQTRCEAPEPPEDGGERPTPVPQPAPVE